MSTQAAATNRHPYGKQIAGVAMRTPIGHPKTRLRKIFTGRVQQMAIDLVGDTFIA